MNTYYVNQVLDYGEQLGSDADTTVQGKAYIAVQEFEKKQVSYMDAYPDAIRYSEIAKEIAERHGVPWYEMELALDKFSKRWIMRHSPSMNIDKEILIDRPPVRNISQTPIMMDTVHIKGTAEKKSNMGPILLAVLAGATGVYLATR